MEILQSAGFWWPVLLLGAAVVVWFAGGLLWWLLAGVPLLAGFSLLGDASGLTKVVIWVVYITAIVGLAIPAARIRLFSASMMRLMRNQMPPISRTERQALESGGDGWEKELFGGRPLWRRFNRNPAPRLREAELNFLDGPVEDFCRAVSDYRLNAEDQDLPEDAWSILRRERFFGMIIPEEFDGLGFSACAHAAVVMKIASRSIAAALTVMIPNSVGPAKLILKYGTEEQKQTWLPRLARGEETPCFALTGPEAGSDAASIPDTGIVCRQDWDGRESVLGLRVSFDKRYISLAPIATLLGVAVKVYDPDGLLGDRRKLGISLVLVPADAPGVDAGLRHDPLHMGFHNGPVKGKDVFVPLESIIGGPEGIGRGWGMLLECLTDGRAISLPALSCAAAKIATRCTGAYARLRYQFKTPIARFEGVQEALAQIAGHSFAMEGARQLILMELEQGKQPAVASAIVKYNLTDRCRRVLDHAMDIHAGAGISLGPRNLIGEFHKFPPIGVTVEGANILTRSLITFGQGVIRCHPCLKSELDAATSNDVAAQRVFDRVLARHLRLFARNLLRSVVHGLTGARLAAVPRGTTDPGSYQQIGRLSAAFALTTDVLLFTQRGSFRQSERMSARMADVLSQMYIACGALRLFEESDPDDSDRLFKDWVVADSLFRAQDALEEVLRNLPGPWGRLLRGWIFPLGRVWRRPTDPMDRRLAQLISVPSSGRDRLTAGIFVPVDMSEPLARLEAALRKVTMTEPLAEKLREGEMRELIEEGPFEDKIDSAVAARILTPVEADELMAAERARLAVLEVDAR
jgi:acyl-CoA dehydrogenase